MTFEKLKYYWFIIFLILIFFYRLDFSCFKKECPLEQNGVETLVNFSIFSKIRDQSIYIIEKSFPSPYSELLLGMTIGVDRLSNVPKFKEALKSTGTIHVVVVSGFNISLVFNAILELFGSKYKLKNLLISQFITFVYTLISGFEPPVIRALIMGSILSWGRYYGRGVETLLVLFTSGLLMLVVQPLYFFNLSFVLSFLATLGLVLFSDPFSMLFKRFDFLLIDDFVSSLAAQVLVWPIISFFFGTVSLISILVNTLILWTVSFTTIIGMVFILISICNQFIGSILLIPLYILMKIFIDTVFYFSDLKVGYVNYTLGVPYLAGYYLCVAILLVIGYKFRYKKSSVSL